LILYRLSILKQDIFIKDGIISSISDSHLQNVDQVIDKPGLFISPGWVDIFLIFTDPGLEYKETLESGVAVGVVSSKIMIFLDKQLLKRHIQIYPQFGRHSTIGVTYTLEK
jgi:dihydroorotase-like cyclic amidohydrolase